eukprot:scaffold13109_cov26-Prasinocladus_malaysianus.AAC.1
MFLCTSGPPAESRTGWSRPAPLARRRRPRTGGPGRATPPRTLLPWQTLGGRERGPQRPPGTHRTRGG